MNVEVGDIDTLLKEKSGLLLVDVRTPEEYVTGHIHGARNHNYYSPEFTANLGRLDRDHPCLLYCATGNRSAKAKDILQKLGFQNLYTLAGGIGSWVKAGKALSK